MPNTANYYVIIDRRERSPVAYWLPADLSGGGDSTAYDENERARRQERKDDEPALDDLLYSREGSGSET